MEPIDKAITKFQNHSSVLLIKEKVNNFGNIFSFEEIVLNEVIKETRFLNPKKNGTDNDVPAKILRNCKDSCAPFLRDFSNNIVPAGNFAEKLKLAHVTHIFKKKDSFNKEN